MRYSLLLPLLFLSLVAQAQPLSGTFTVCASGCDYASLTGSLGAFDDINTNGINGNIILQIKGDLSETGSNSLIDFSDSNGPHTITIQPDGPTMRTLSGNNASGLINIAGGNLVIFDGRDPGNTTLDYTNRYLTIVNSSTFGPTISYNSDAVSCAIRAAYIKGRVTTGVGVVDVGGGTISGNDDLTIEYCDVSDDGGNLPWCAIHFSGSSSLNNDNMKILNNHLYNFYPVVGSPSDPSEAYGIYIEDNNNLVTIQGNSFYQTASRSFGGLANYYSGIKISSPAGSGFQISGNFIGGSQASCGGSATVLDGPNSPNGGYMDVRGITIEDIGFTAQTLVSNNTIKGITTANTASTGFGQSNLIGISVNRGYVDILSNTIGDATSSLESDFDASAHPSGGLVAGINIATNASGTGVTSTIRDNAIDHLVASSTGAVASAATAIVGIYVDEQVTSSLLIKQNVVGNLTGSNNMTTNTSSTNILNAVGIDIVNAVSPMTIDRNKVANFSSQGLATGSYARGISYTGTANPSITRNQVYNISSAANNTSSSGAVAGIYFDNASAPGFSILKNTVYNLTNTNTVIVGGIVVGTSGATSQLSNNMVTLGYSTTSDTKYYGIYNYNTVTGTLQLYANTVNITGNGNASNTNNTFGFYRNATSTATLQSNLLLNNRGGSGSHYAIGSTSTTGWTSDYNLLWATNSLTTGFYGSTNYDFAGWQTSTAGDSNSKNVDVSSKFLYPSQGNLRIPDDASALIGNVVDSGAATAGTNPVTDDIDDAPRSGVIDIGASEVLLMWLGTSDSDWSNSANWSGGIIPSCGGRDQIKISSGVGIPNQPTINVAAAFKEMIILDGASITMTTGGSVTQCNTGTSPYSLVNNGSLTLNAQTVNLYGDFYQNSTFDPGTGTLAFIGGSTQILDGDGPLTLTNMTVDGGGAKTLNESLTITGSITFTSGLINTSSTNLLTFSTTGSYTGGSASSYVNGPVAKLTNSTSTFTFPIGKGGNYRVARITPSSASGTTTFTGEYFNGNPNGSYPIANKVASITNVSALEYWIINRSGPSNGYISLTWDANSGISNVSADRAQLVVSRWNGSKWTNMGGSATGNAFTDAIPGEMISSLITSFSPFTIASQTLNNPLPVELVNFKATAVGAKVKITWQTYSEINSNYFYLESSKDGEKFTKVSDNISGYGTTSEIHYYTTWDSKPYNGLSYYRLVQVDLDGEKTTYNPVAVQVDVNATIGIVVSPNPVSSERFTLTISSFPSNSDVQIQIVDVSGRIASQTAVATDSRGNGSIEMTHQLARGFYVIKAASYEQSAVTKIVVR